MNQPTFVVVALYIGCSIIMATTVIVPECGSSAVSKQTIDFPRQVQSAKEVPAPTKPCPPEVADWWKQVREAGRAAIDATSRRDKALIDAVQSLYFGAGGVPDDDEKVLPKKWKQLTEAVNNARTRFKHLLSIATEKSYQVPFADQKPIVLYFPQARYTEVARRSKLTGIVKGRALLASDGMVTRVNITSELGLGLDDRALITIYNLIFLPAVRDGRFVNYMHPVEVEFKLR